jgi:putative ABC transport system permease protein
LILGVLALGIGANTAIFSIIRAALLRPLPYADPENLVYLWLDDARTPLMDHGIVTGHHVLEWRSQSRTVGDIGALKLWDGNLDSRFDWVHAGGAERLRGALVTPNFFRLLGVNAGLGRTFLDSTDDAQPVVVISDRLWRRRFASTPSIVGASLPLSTRRHAQLEYSVIGVLPPDFRYTYPEEVEVWAVLPWSAIQPTPALNYQVIGRVKSPHGSGEAGAELTAITRQLIEDSDGPAEGRTSLANRTAIVVEPVPQHFRSEARSGTILLGLVAGLVLVTACISAALLVSARTVGRRSELALRMTLGASPWSLACQLLAEGTVLAVIGTVAGLLLAYLSLPALIAILPPVLSRGDEATLDAQVLAFAAVTCVLTAAVCGLAGAYHTLRTADLLPHIRGSASPVIGGTSNTTLRVLVGAEVATVLALTVTAGLLLYSFWRIQHVDVGFDSRGVVAAEIRLLNQKYRERGRIVSFEQALVSELRSVPGVLDVATTTAIPMRGVDFQWLVPSPDGSMIRSYMRSVDPDYFSLLGVRLLAGRWFTQADGANGPRVGIVSEALARALFGGRPVIGEQLQLASNTEIVGVVADVRSKSATSSAQPALYLPRAQQPSELVCLLVRTTTETSLTSVTMSIREVVRKIDPEQPIEGITSMSHLVANTTGEQRFYTVSTAAFAIIAVCVGIAGLCGVVAQRVSERRRDFAVRIALGANSRQISVAALREILIPVMFGIVVGIPAAYVMSRVVELFLFEISRLDPIVHVGSVLVVLIAAAAACYPSVRSALRAEPIALLKAE